MKKEKQEAKSFKEIMKDPPIRIKIPLYILLIIGILTLIALVAKIAFAIGDASNGLTDDDAEQLFVLLNDEENLSKTISFRDGQKTEKTEYLKVLMKDKTVSIDEMLSKEETDIPEMMAAFATNAEKISIAADVSNITDTMNYNTKNVYDIILYKYMDKWFLYNISEKLSVITDIDVKSKIDYKNMIGDEDNGYVATISEYTPTDLDASYEKLFYLDDAQASIYTNETDKTAIMFLNGYSSKSTNDLAETFYDALTADSFNKRISTDIINGIPCQKIVTGSLNDNCSYYIWMYRIPIRDDKVRIIMLKAENDPNAYASIENTLFI